MAFFLRRWRRNFLTNIFPQFIVGILFIYLYSEYIIYYVTQIQCGWSSLSKEYNGVNVVYAMVIADTHLLGSRDGYWIDKWRREWQMHRAFQTAMTLHQPEVVFVLDLLKCSSGSSLCKGKTRLARYSRPIIMQHYPLYRESDSICTEPDAAPLPERNGLFEERWDCLSKESTEYLVENLLPRAAFGAHTHHGCVVRHSFMPTSKHKIEFIEYTVPSFSWRNRPDPKYYLLTITPDEVKVSKCSMPSEWTMQVTAILMTMALVVYLRYFNMNINLLGYKYLSGKKV